MAGTLTMKERIAARIKADAEHDEKLRKKRERLKKAEKSGADTGKKVGEALRKKEKTKPLLRRIAELNGRPAHINKTVDEKSRGDR